MSKNVTGDLENVAGVAAIEAKDGAVGSPVPQDHFLIITCTEKQFSGSIEVEAVNTTAVLL